MHLGFVGGHSSCLVATDAFIRAGYNIAAAIHGLNQASKFQLSKCFNDSICRQTVIFSQAAYTWQPVTRLELLRVNLEMNLVNYLLKDWCGEGIIKVKLHKQPKWLEKNRIYLYHMNDTDT